MGRRKGEILTTPKAVPTVQSIDVQIDKVKVGERMRSLDMAKVSELADSINQNYNEIAKIVHRDRRTIQRWYARLEINRDALFREYGHLYPQRFP